MNRYARAVIERARGGGRSTEATIAGLVFVVALLVAFPLYLVRGHDQWFFLDDWDFLAGRQLTSLHDLFRAHNEHWSTLPIIVYRVLWKFVGLRSYVPYQAVLVALHLTAATLLRRIMRRAGVGPWIATAAALLFLFLGSGRQNIVWAFQIGFVGALVCGLAHLILADHDGPLDRRDALGIAFGVVGLLCSGVAVTMTLIVGLAVLIRRGWQVAAVHTVPLGIIYGVWYVAIGRDAYDNPHSSAGDAWSFLTTGLKNAFAEIGQVPGLGTVLVVVLVVGLGLAWVRTPIGELRRRAAAPVALLVGSVIFFAIAAFGRAAFLGTDGARATRYVHLVAAMTLPAIAVAADALARRWRYLTPFAMVILLLGVPGNIIEIRAQGRERVTRGNPALMLELPRLPFARRVPRSVHPNPVGAAEVEIGWLLDGVRSGRIPKPAAGSVTPRVRARATLGLALQQTAPRVATRACVTVTSPVRRTVRRGDVLVFKNARLAVQLKMPNEKPSIPSVFEPLFGEAIRVEGGPLTLIVGPAAPARRVVLCRGA